VQVFKVVCIASGERDPSTTAATLALSKEDEGSMLQLSYLRPQGCILSESNKVLVLLSIRAHLRKVPSKQS
jgi:hypothetical protein